MKAKSLKIFSTFLIYQNFQFNFVMMNQIFELPLFYDKKNRGKEENKEKVERKKMKRKVKIQSQS